MSNWREISIGDLAEEGHVDIKTGPFGTQFKASEYVEEGIPMINVRNIGMGKIRPEKLEFLSEITAKRLKKHTLKKDDIVFGRKGAVERHVIIKKEQEGWLQGSDCIRMRFDSKEILPEYVSYYLCTRYHQIWINNLSSSGATMSSLNQEIIGRIKFRLPDLETQSKIISILSNYDKLIEINDRRIALLEEMAEEIYKEWFIQFRFPNWKETKFFNTEGEEVPKETQESLPEDWEIGKFEEFFDTSSGGTPSRKNQSFYEDGIHNWVKTKELLGTFIFSTEEKITHEAIEKSSAKLFPPNTILMGMYGGVHGKGRKSTLGQVGIITEYSSTNQACCAFLPIRKEEYSYPYLLFYLKFKQMEFLNLSMGAAQQNISQEIIRRFKFIKPKNSILSEFENIILPIFEEIKVLLKKNTNLQKTRDLLLPRLVSGKLCLKHLVPETETF